ncbi:hypothetical protein MLD38_021664 [Melastoma candidum]|uniref:Uncharacterized protein n=1 Tax=Melastoma candidum TaxID=119954 RepID=A0ACB9QH08_9MYRT|nr:hypothetical protein MLD38_021664 [Melastoma candidum]
MHMKLMKFLQRLSPRKLSTYPATPRRVLVTLTVFVTARLLAGGERTLPAKEHAAHGHVPAPASNRVCLPPRALPVNKVNP